MLSNIVILDLADEKGDYCSRLLGDLGAEVIKIENLGGNSNRSIGPFYHGQAHPEKSLSWFSFNCNKKSVTLDIETNDGKLLFKRLVKMADVIMESFPPGYMDAQGLSYSTLKIINPGFIMTSITPFGQTGPYCMLKSSDIVSMAMSGLMYLTGDSDRPPVRISTPQAYLHAGLHGAIGTILALLSRQVNGQGQQVDVSIQQSIIIANANALRYWEMAKLNQKRAGAFMFRPFLNLNVRHTWPCKDGYICFLLVLGVQGGRRMPPLVEWMDSEGMAPDYLKEIDWPNTDFNSISQDYLDRIAEPILNFFMTKTKAAIVKGAIARNLPIFPVATPRDILEDEQLNARGYWIKKEHPEINDTLIYPGPWVKLSKTPLKTKMRAPLIGEHNEEIYKKRLGLSSDELAILKNSRVI